MRYTVLFLLFLFAQLNASSQDTLSWKKVDLRRSHHVQKLTKGFSLNGYYRFYGLNRNLETPFIVLPDNQFASTPPFVFSAGDVYRDPPIMLLTTSIRPGGGASIGMDWAMYSNFTGSNGQVPYNLNLGISLYGNIPTPIAKVGFQLGGINWTDVSDMVFSSFDGYERFSLFERWAWEGIGQASDRAENFINTGRINREERWARQAFKGILLDFTELPHGLSTRFLYGKTPVTASLLDNTPRFTTGGRVRKNFGKNYVGVNTMNYIEYSDSTGRERSGIGLHTVNFMYKSNKFRLKGEVGIGERYSPDGQKETGEGIRLNLALDSSVVGFPIEVEYFRLAPEFVNYYGNFLSTNTAFLGTVANQNVGGGGGATNFAGSLTDVGQILNNRQGYTVNSWFQWKNTRFNFGLMNSSELERVSNKLSFGHKINGQTLSRFAPFANNVGPYKRWNSFYRGVSEDMFITETDSLGLPRERLNFSTLQLQVKQRIPLEKHPIYFLTTASFGSVGSDLLFIPNLSNKSYLRASYVESDLIIKLANTLDLTIGAGLERIRGNDQTNNLYYLDSSGNVAGANVSADEPVNFNALDGTAIVQSNVVGAETAAQGPIDQTSTMIGAGLDVKLSPNSGVYIRHRRFSQIDENFKGDEIKGTETTIELKIYF